MKTKFKQERSNELFYTKTYTKNVELGESLTVKRKSLSWDI